MLIFMIHRKVTNQVTNAILIISNYCIVTRDAFAKHQQKHRFPRHLASGWPSDLVPS